MIGDLTYLDFRSGKLKTKILPAKKVYMAMIRNFANKNMAFSQPTGWWIRKGLSPVDSWNLSRAIARSKIVLIGQDSNKPDNGVDKIVVLSGGEAN